MNNAFQEFLFLTKFKGGKIMKVNLKRFTAAMLSSAMLFTSFAIPTFADETATSEAINVLAVQNIGIYESSGWLEAAYVEWKPTSTDGIYEYEVSYSKDGTNYTTIDSELIRKYPTYWRADIVGLAAGDYTIKVDAKDENGDVKDSETTTVTVVAQDRTGFNFSPKSRLYDNGGCGAYNADGTLKSNANVIYVTESNFDTVKLNLTDKSKKAYTAVGLADICKTIGAAASKGVTNPPLSVRFIGTLTDSHNDLASPGLLETKGESDYTKINITFEGIGEDTIFYGLALRLNGAGNCEIRNISFFNWHDDAIQIQGNGNSNHWIHNNDLFYGENHGGDQKKGDGSTDVKDDTQYTTYSYNHYWDSGKTSLCGMKSETGDNYITYQHNWFDHSDSRHPRIRTMFVHVYNNYYDGNAKYGVGAAKSSSAFVEGNYFRNCKHPMLSSLQGSDIMENPDTGVADFSYKGTFSKEDGGVIKAYNNYVVGSDADKFNGGVEPVYYDATDTKTNGKATQFDAYLAQSRDEEVPSTVKALVGGKTFNNDNVDSYILSIPVEEPEVAKDKVVKYAGRLGDHFTFTFTSADDKLDEINTELESKLKTYVTDTSDDFVSIGGLVSGSSLIEDTTQTTTSSSDATTQTTTSSGSDGTTQATTTSPVTPGTGYVHNFSTDGTSSSFYSITGSMKSGVASKTYNGLTLTQALKMETSTKITFTAPSSGKLLLVTDTASKGIKIDGTKYKTDSNGVLEQAVTAGSHTIQKGDSLNVYYISLTLDGSSGEVTTEATTETTSEVTTEATTTNPVTTKEPETSDAKDGISVSYDEASKTWTLTDTSVKDETTGFAGNAAELTIPFEEKSEGTIVIKAKVTPSVASSKWSLLSLRGADSDGNSGEIISFGSDANKNLAVRTGGTAYNSSKVAVAKDTTYDVTIVLDLNTGDATVTANDLTFTNEGIDVASVSSLYFVTSLSGARNLTVSDVSVGMAAESENPVTPVTPVTPSEGLIGDADGDGKVTGKDAAYVLKYVKDNSVIDLTDEKLALLDLNKDNVLDEKDALLILDKARHND
jgi:pectate lyase